MDDDKICDDLYKSRHVIMDSANLDSQSSHLRYHVGAKKVTRTNRILRLANVALVLTLIWNMVWVLTNLDLSSAPRIVLSILFAAASIGASLLGIIHTLNNWHFKTVKPKLFSRESRPKVGVLIPV